MSDRDAATRLLCAGASASVADVMTFPLDTIKVRLQVASGLQSGLLGCGARIISQEGIPALYNGLAAGLQRQFAFASIRIGCYEPVKKFYGDSLKLNSESGSAAVMSVRLMAGCTTGALAVLCAQPTEVVKIRMQGGAVKYSSTLSAYSTIFKNEGIRGLWKGLGPNVARNSIVNCSEVVTYDTLKTYLIRRFQLKDGISTYFLSGLGSGFITTLVASPVDVVKTRYMNAPVGKYTGVVNCAMRLCKDSGFKGFYKGFLPSFLRIAGWNVLMFIIYEKSQYTADVMKPVFRTRYALAKEKRAESVKDCECGCIKAGYLPNSPQIPVNLSSDESSLSEGLYVYHLLMSADKLS